MSNPDSEGVVYLGSRHREAALRQMQEKPRPTPRLGRREYEPHSHKINYLHDVLTTYFPDDRAFWDLHHYFDLEGNQIDLQFDISYFKGLIFLDQVSSFRSKGFDGRIPTMAINILSSSTYNTDLGLTAQTCQELGILVYVIFSDHIFEPKAVKAPFLKVIYEEGGRYHMAELHEPFCTEEGNIDPSKLLDIRPDLLPFMFDIMELKDRYWKKGKQHRLYQLILIDRKTGEKLRTKAEMALEKAEEAKRRAQEAERRTEEAEKKAEEERRLRLEMEKERRVKEFPEYREKRKKFIMHLVFFTYGWE